MIETSTTAKAEPLIRIATLTDLPAIVAIYNQAVPSHRSTANTVPVTLEERKTWFSEHDPAKHPIFVAGMGDRVAGWCSLSPYRPGRMALRYTAELSCYVDGAFQSKGIGSAMVRHLMEVCPSLEIKNIVAVVIDQNQGSRKLLKKMVFLSGDTSRVFWISKVRNLANSIMGNGLPIKDPFPKFAGKITCMVEGLHS